MNRKQEKYYANAKIAAHPHIAAKALFPNCSTEEIVEKIVQFAQTYDDTNDFVKFIRKSFPAFISPNFRGYLFVKAKDTLPSLAFECGGANVNFLISQGRQQPPPEAVLIWLSGLSFDLREGDIGGFQGIASYAMFCSKTQDITFLVDATYNYIRVRIPDDVVAAVLCHMIICDAVGVKDRAEEAVRERMKFNYSGSSYSFIDLMGKMNYDIDSFFDGLNHFGNIDSLNIYDNTDIDFEGLKQKCRTVLKKFTTRR